MSDARSESRVAALDGLRGLSALLILQLHYLPTLEPRWLPAPLADLARTSFIGVDLFFALSGYLIGTIVFQRGDAPNFLRVFYARRALRILPLFGLMLVLALLGDRLTQDLLPRFRPLFQPDLPWWCYASFSQNLAPIVLAGVQVPAPWFSTAWSLAVEEHFYLAAPLLARLGSRRLLVHGALALLLLSPLLRLGGDLAGAGAMHLYTATPFRLDGLAAGVLVAANQAGFLGAPRRSPSPALALVLFGAAILWFTLDNPMRADSLPLTRYLGYSLIAIAAALLVRSLAQTGTRLGALLSCRPLRLAGTWAYGLYLLHVPVLWLTHLVLRGALPSLETPAAIATTGLAALLAVAAAAASWYGLERHCLALAHRFRYEHPVSPKEPETAEAAARAP